MVFDKAKLTVSGLNLKGVSGFQNFGPNKQPDSKGQFKRVY